MNTSPSVRGLFIVGGLAAAIACVGVVHGQITFTGLGPSIFLATDVTNDGSAVVGLGATAGYRWTKSTGAVALPGLSGSGYTSTSPMAISSNGTTVGLTA